MVLKIQKQKKWKSYLNKDSLIIYTKIYNMNILLMNKTKKLA